ncbi:MAG: leucine-rich repeat protein [Clostridia bacterium]|nr:leucine-rich repeat protein [Clostridia bacterium]
MKKFLAKIFIGTVLCCGTVALSCAGAMAAGVAAEYTLSSDKIYNVKNPSTATYANINKNVTLYCNGYRIFNSSVTSGGVTYDSYLSYRYYYGMFSRAPNLKYVNIEKGVTSLGYNVFFDNHLIKSIVFPDNAVSFSKSLVRDTSSYSYPYYYTPTFGCIDGLEEYYCSVDYDVSLPYGTKVTYNYNDGNLLYKLKDDGTYEVLYALPGRASVNIPDSANDIKVTSIADGAFTSDEDLTTITIPGTITSIGADAFKDCAELKAVIIPASVKTIGDEAFSGCTALNAISIPPSVETIGEGVFFNCSAIAVECERGSAADDSSLYPSGSAITYKLYVIKGDADNSGVVDIIDAVEILNYIENGEELKKTENADVNGDGGITIEDAALILKYCANITDSL